MGLGSGDTFLALDSSDTPYINYLDCNPFGCLSKFAEWVGSSWSITDVDGVGSLDIDTNNNPHISYKFGIIAGQTNLRYISLSGGSWITETVDLEPIDNRNISLKLDGNDSPHISYYKQDNLMYSFWDSGSWISQAVDTSMAIPFFLGQDTSLVLDTNDYPHIAYYDGDSSDLKYVEWSGTEWLIQTVDSAGDVGKYASLALDSSGVPHISYYDADNQAVKYASLVSNSWQIIAVEAGVGDGDVISLIIDSTDRLHLSYYYYGGENNRLLQYAWKDVTFFDYSVYLPLTTK